MAANCSPALLGSASSSKKASRVPMGTASTSIASPSVMTPPPPDTRMLSSTRAANSVCLTPLMPADVTNDVSRRSLDGGTRNLERSPRVVHS